MILILQQHDDSGYYLHHRHHHHQDSLFLVHSCFLIIILSVTLLLLSFVLDGPRLGTMIDKSKKYSLRRLKLARDIAVGLSHVHYGRNGNNASFVHLDVNPANIVVANNKLKLNDFNIGIKLKRNVTSGLQCGFPSQFPNPQWRSPEEVNESTSLDEKVDVFSLGHIFFRMICGHEPYNKLEVGGRPSSSAVREKVKAGQLPRYVLELLVIIVFIISESFELIICYTAMSILTKNS